MLDNWVHSVNRQQDNGHISLCYKTIGTMKCTVMAFKALSVYWMKLVIKRPAELHTACGFKPYTVVVYSVHSWVCWVMLLSHRVHCKYPFSQWDLCLRDEYFPNGRKGQIRKTNFFSFFFFFPQTGADSRWFCPSVCTGGEGGFEPFFPNLVPEEGNVQWENPLEIMMWWVYSDGEVGHFAGRTE